jgi:chromosome segregation ATPase
VGKKKSTEQLDRDIQNLVKKISIIEKFVNVEKNQQDTRVEKLEKSSELIDKSLKALRIEVQALNQNFDKDLNEHNEKLAKVIDDFNSFQNTLDSELEKVIEKDKVMEELRSEVKIKTALLEEKEKSIANMEEKYSTALEKIVKLESDLANVEINYEQVKTLQEEMKRKLESTEGEYSDFKSKEEPVRAQNESIRRILNAHEQGKIFLALISASPNSLSLDELADIIGSTTVMIKPSLLALEDLEVIEFNPSTREIKLI